MPTPATPDMVTQVGALQEFEMTPEGVKPLSPQNQADPSQTASPEGAPAEPAGNAAEATPPATAQTPETPVVPATASVVQPAPSPAVTVDPATAPVPTQPATAPTPTDATAPAQPEVKPDDGGLAKLGAYIQGETAKVAEEARRAAQSQYDRQNAQVAQALQVSKEATAQVTQELRELQTRDLSEAERAKVMETYAQKDERSELDKYRAELVGYHNTVFDDSLLVQYKDVEGVTKEALATIETPEEKELFCEQKRSASLEKQLEESKVTATAPAAPVAAAPATPVPAPPAVPNAPGVPAGATAPSDIGTGGPPPEEKKFSEEPSAGALQSNLRNMDWNRVRIA